MIKIVEQLKTTKPHSKLFAKGERKDAVIVSLYRRYLKHDPFKNGLEDFFKEVDCYFENTGLSDCYRDYSSVKKQFMQPELIEKVDRFLEKWKLNLPLISENLFSVYRHWKLENDFYESITCHRKNDCRAYFNWKQENDLNNAFSLTYATTDFIPPFKITIPEMSFEYLWAADIAKHKKEILKQYKLLIEGKITEALNEATSGIEIDQYRGKLNEQHIDWLFKKRFQDKSWNKIAHEYFVDISTVRSEVTRLAKLIGIDLPQK